MTNWLKHNFFCNFSVVSCQRYLCHNVIPLTMTVLINHCIKIIRCIDSYVKITHSLSISLSQ